MGFSLEGKPVHSLVKVKVGQVLEAGGCPEAEQVKVPGQASESDVIYEDEYLLSGQQACRCGRAQT